MLGRGASVRRFCSAIPPPQPWLFVGLGNPGEKYQGTRLNVGFGMIDAFAKLLGVAINRVHCKALFGEVLIGETPVFLVKPQTYMNQSGESIFDDMNLPCGVLRLHPKGGPGGHNGLKSVIHHFRGNREFPRLRIGIGRPPGQMDPKAFVLQKFNVTARERVDTAVQEGVEIWKFLINKGFTEAAKCINTQQKYKHLRLQTMET